MVSVWSRTPPTTKACLEVPLMLFSSQIISRGSGSIGGLVASHNSGGNYFRARVTPVNPNTPAQALVRGIMAMLSNRWVNVLTQVQRDAWELYAVNVPLSGPLGDTRNVGGIGMYIRGNLMKSHQGITLADDAPTIFDTGDFTPVVLDSATTSTQLCNLTFTEADDWVGEDNAMLLFHTGPAQNPGINYFTGPYRFGDTVLGNLAVPPTTPDTLGVTHAFAAGQRVFAFARVLRADGRLSALQRLTVIAVA